jgi:hypothetical protein
LGCLGSPAHEIRCIVQAPAFDQILFTDSPAEAEIVPRLLPDKRCVVLKGFFCISRAFSMVSHTRKQSIVLNAHRVFSCRESLPGGPSLSIKRMNTMKDPPQHEDEAQVWDWSLWHSLSLRRVGDVN